jgi:polyisoprenoid-binding protein YceI
MKMRSVTTAFGLMVGGAVLAAVALVSAQQAPGGGQGQGGQRPGGAQGGQQQQTPPTAGMNLEIAEGTATYTVSEQFVGIDFPNDAMGSSSKVAGTLGIAKDGSVVPGSKLTVDLSALKSDQDMRDNFAKTRTLETDKFPMAEFVPTKVEGLPTMIPTNGQSGFKLTGNMTIHGVTKEVTFQGIATYGRDNTVSGIAKTSFGFDTFGLAVPKIGRLANVDNKINLALQFKFKRS